MNDIRIRTRTHRAGVLDSQVVARRLRESIDGVEEAESDADRVLWMATMVVLIGLAGACGVLIVLVH